jgi:hypothetical protein
MLEHQQVQLRIADTVELDLGPVFFAFAPDTDARFVPLDFVRFERVLGAD